MSKKDNEVKNLNLEIDPVIRRKAKMESLGQNIFKTIEAESKKSGTFSIFEIIEVLVKCLHSYNKRFLNEEHQNIQREFRDSKPKNPTNNN